MDLKTPLVLDYSLAPRASMSSRRTCERGGRRAQDADAGQGVMDAGPKSESRRNPKHCGCELVQDGAQMNVTGHPGDGANNLNEGGEFTPAAGWKLPYFG